MGLQFFQLSGRKIIQDQPTDNEPESRKSRLRCSPAPLAESLRSRFFSFSARIAVGASVCRGRAGFYALGRFSLRYRSVGYPRGDGQLSQQIHTPQVCIRPGPGSTCWQPLFLGSSSPGGICASCAPGRSGRVRRSKKYTN